MSDAIPEDLVKTTGTDSATRRTLSRRPKSRPLQRWQQAQ